MNEPTPLVVCGMPRSGTRHFVNVLNVHKGISLTGEIPMPVMRKLFALIDTIDDQYAGNETYLGNWHRKRSHFFLESMFLVSKSRSMPALEGRVYAGTKTPNHEFLFDDYERFFRQSEVKPAYVFCARNPESCWASYRSMPWAQQNLREFMKRYVRSYETLDRMLAAAPQRCIVANLDELARADAPAEYLSEKVFKPLGLELGSDEVTAIGNLKNSNSTVSKVGTPPAPLPKGELSRIRKNVGVQKYVERYFRF